MGILFTVEVHVGEQGLIYVCMMLSLCCIYPPKSNQIKLYRRERSLENLEVRLDFIIEWLKNSNFRASEGLVSSSKLVNRVHGLYLNKAIGRTVHMSVGN